MEHQFNRQSVISDAVVVALLLWSIFVAKPLFALGHGILVALRILPTPRIIMSIGVLDKNWPWNFDNEIAIHSMRMTPSFFIGIATCMLALVAWRLMQSKPALRHVAHALIFLFCISAMASVASAVLVLLV